MSRLPLPFPSTRQILAVAAPPRAQASATARPTSGHTRHIDMTRIIKPTSSVLFNSRLGYTAYIYASGPLLQQIYRPSVQHQRIHQFALSLLPHLAPPPASSASPPHPATIFAWTHSDQPGQLHHDSLDQPDFLRLMHATIARASSELDYLLSSRARRQGSGWLGLVDERAPLLYGRAPDPDDTIGMVQCQEGAVLPSTYDPMPAYRLVSPLGIFSLPKPLHQLLLKALASLQTPPS